MKKKISIIIVLVLCTLTFISCNGHVHSWGEWMVEKEATCEEEGIEIRSCECGETITRSILPNASHRELKDKIENSSFKMSYSELYSIYEDVIAHKNKSQCDFEISNLLQNMLYGEWKDSNDNFVSYTYIYSDYNNTLGSTWYGTNLTTSMISGNTYYYYFNVEENNLIIGYKDKITEEGTDNFVISFNTDSISVKNKIDGINYNLTANKNYDKVQEGNAKTAYIYIAKNIFLFKAPNSVTITQCYVEYEEKVVYATIQATNGFGGTNNTKYKLYEIDGQYFIEEFNHDYYDTNIELTELNQKLQSYVATGG